MFKFQELNQKLSDLKEQYAKDLRDNDKRWRSCLDKKIDEIEEKYKEEINELTKEWNIDRKVCGLTNRDDLLQGVPFK